MLRMAPLAITAVFLIASASPASALPTSVADAGVFMVDGPRVDDIAQVGSQTWIGGNFDKVLNGKGSVVASASGLTVLDGYGRLIATTNDALPALGGKVRDVYDLSVAPNGTLYAAGRFTYTSGGTTYRNLIGIDPASGRIVSRFNARPLKSVLATSGYVYGGGRKLWRFAPTGGTPDGSWHAITAYVDTSLRGHRTAPSFRAIERVDRTRLLAVGQFDWIDGKDAAHQKKVAVMVDVRTGRPDLGSGSWSIRCPCARQSKAAFGLAADIADGVIYVAAGGNDLVVAVRPSDGSLLWQTDVNGSAQAVAVYDGSTLIVGGHFTSIEQSGAGDTGAGECPDRHASNQAPCWLQPRLAAVSRSTGLAIKTWAPNVCCLYRGVWATTVEGAAIHVGGEFKKLDNDRGPEYYYGRFS